MRSGYGAGRASVREKFLQMTPELYRYMVEHGTRRDPLLEEVEREADELGWVAVMQIAPEQGAFLELLTRALGARRAIEVGTFTGYSAICIARGLAPGGALLCCELNEDWAARARDNFARAGLADRIELRVGPALDTLRALPPDPVHDLAFVDADKPGYRDYYEELLPRIREGGLILLDNVLLGGTVAGEESEDFSDESVEAMRRLNDAVAGDERVDVAMVSISDGLTLLRKR
jgi:caffeoyl-CoA O-methyltransferase